MAKMNKAMWWLGFAGLMVTGFSWGFCKGVIDDSEV